METRHFHYIRTIYEAGSISRAAQQLYISQPSLSQLLKNIEKKVGAPLFDRSIQPLRPTTIGRKYLAAAKHIMEIDAEFRQYVEDELGCAQGNLIVGSSPFRSTYFLASFLPQFQTQYPGIRLQLAEHTSKRLEEAVLSGDVDLIIATQPVDTEAFACAELYAEEMILVLPAKHPLAKAYDLPQDCRGNLPVLPISLLKDTPFIQMHSEQKLHHQLLSICEEGGFTPADIGHVNAHGTGTPANDKTESIALYALCDDDELAAGIPMTSIKGTTGHTLGAAGAVEAIVCALSVARDCVPPTAGFAEADPECAVNVVTEALTGVPQKVALSNSLGFGGHNATLAFSPYTG